MNVCPSGSKTLKGVGLYRTQNMEMIVNQELKQSSFLGSSTSFVLLRRHVQIVLVQSL
jgi:hypothetical protein